MQAKAKWPEALEVTKRAEGFLASGGRESARAHVREFRRDLEMVKRLEEIRHPQDLSGPEGARDNEWMNATYAVAFREFGTDIESLEPAEAIRRVRDRAISVELALALDHWAHIRRRMRKEDHEGRRRLIAVSKTADPDPWRNRVRDALEARDARALSDIAESANVIDLPVQTLTLLCEELTGEFGSETGVVVLRAAQRKYPDDFWINFQLAWAMDHRERPMLEEAVRYYTGRRWPCDRATHRRTASWHVTFSSSGGWRKQSPNIARPSIGRSTARGPTTSSPGFWPVLPMRDFAPRLRLSDWPGEPLSWTHETAPHGIPWALPSTASAIGRLRLRRWNARQSSAAAIASTGFFSPLRGQKGERDEARRLYDLAVSWMERHKPVDSELCQFRAEAGALLGIGARGP